MGSRSPGLPSVWQALWASAPLEAALGVMVAFFAAAIVLVTLPAEQVDTYRRFLYLLIDAGAGGLAVLWVLRYQAWRVDDERERGKHQENMTAHRAHLAAQADAQSRLTALQVAADSRTRRDTVRRTDELLKNLYQLVRPYVIAKQRCVDESDSAEATKERADAWKAAIDRYASTYSIPVGIILLEYRDEHGVDIEKASAIVKEDVTAVEQIISLANMLNEMGANLLFSAPKQ